LDGGSVNVGTDQVDFVTQNAQSFNELVFGGTTVPNVFEINFNGHIKEFRWWNVLRT